MFHAVKKKITKFHDPSVWFLPCICPRLLSLFLLSLYLLCKTPTLVKSNPLPPLGLPLGTWTITSPPECLPKLFSMQQSNFLKSPYPLKPFNLFTAFRIESKPIHILCGTLHALTLSYLSNLLFQHTPPSPSVLHTSKFLECSLFSIPFLPLHMLLLPWAVVPH